jgi:hypothetical protein
MPQFYSGCIVIYYHQPSGNKALYSNQAIDFLNKDLKMGMSIDDIDVNFFGDVTIKGLRLKDYKIMSLLRQKN